MIVQYVDRQLFRQSSCCLSSHFLPIELDRTLRERAIALGLIRNIIGWYNCHYQLIRWHKICLLSQYHRIPPPIRANQSELGTCLIVKALNRHRKIQCRQLNKTPRDTFPCVCASASKPQDSQSLTEQCGGPAVGRFSGVETLWGRPLKTLLGQCKSFCPREVNDVVASKALAVVFGGWNGLRVL